jgi:hypothetical protein
MHVFGSERGILATPTRCGTYSVDSTFAPWNDTLPEQTSKQFFTIDSGPDGSPCPGAVRPFSPGFQAGVADKTAGVHAPFSLELTRSDGEQNLAGLNVTTPPGLAATLKGIPYCPEVAIGRLSDFAYLGMTELSSSSCPAASRVGSVIAGAGAGTRPVHVSGSVYLAGPYRGAPLSFLFVIPAVSGPYDLGNVVVRVGIQVDPVTARVTTISDPLPQIVAGIPLRTRSIQVMLDRPGFTLNPTNCDPSTVEATVSGDEGSVVHLSRRLQVANCSSLTYGPELSLKLSGGVQRRGHPAIRAELKTSPGEANSRMVSVTLPKGELLDNAHIGTVCTRVQFAARSCPSGSELGSAEATTPLLDEPLKGRVFLRSSSNKLPDLAVDLRGQIDIELAGRIDSVSGRLRTTFESLPDAPVSAFVLKLKGGARGLLQNTSSLCGTSKSASVRMTGQNGAKLRSKTKLQVSCGGGARHKRSVRRAREAA